MISCPTVTPEMKLATIFFAIALVLLEDVAAQEGHFCTGLDVDGTIDDWVACSSPESTLSLRQVGLPDSDFIVDGLRARFAYDDTHVYVLARVRAGYYFNLTAGNTLSHSFSVMWKVGADATMQAMGGCVLSTSAANATSAFDCAAFQSYCGVNPEMCSCDAHMVDVWHMETSNPGALPGVTYPMRVPNVFTSGGSYESLGYDPEGLGEWQTAVERLSSGNDHSSNSDDEYSVHPCLRDDDGSGKTHLRPYRKQGTNYRNQLKYAWSHTAIDGYQYPFTTEAQGIDGWYTYEFSRPLYSAENTDANFTTSQTLEFAFALWIPKSINEGWLDANHYVAPDNFQFGSLTLVPSGSLPTAQLPSVCVATVVAIMWMFMGFN